MVRESGDRRQATAATIAGRFRLLVAAALIVFATVLSLQGQTPEAATPVPQRHRDLVRQLGADDFKARERAAAALQELGLAARESLIEGLNASDLEVRLRSHNLLQRILNSDFETALSGFIEGKTDPPAKAAWEKLKSLTGDTLEARRLFSSMLRHEGGLLRSASENQEGYTDQFLERVQGLYERLVQGGVVRGQPVSDETLATVLLLAGDEQLDDRERAHIVSVVYRLLIFPTSKELMLGSSNATYLMMLLERFARQQIPTYATFAIELSLTYELQEVGLEAARPYFEEKDSRYANAVIVMGRFGNDDDLRALEKSLTNTTVCHTWLNPAISKDQLKIQIRDVALAMLLHRSGENPSEYHYKHLRTDARTVYRIYSMCFAEDAEREAALKKWEDFRGKQANDQPGGSS